MVLAGRVAEHATLLATLLQASLLAATRAWPRSSRRAAPYFVFYIQTRAYFMQTLLAGGATYRATGRGFVTTHNSTSSTALRRLALGVELAAALG